MNKIDFFSHNWLALKINNESITKKLHLIRGRVIDCGCGDCQYKEDILRFADEYIGVDWEKSRHKCGKVDVYADLNEKLPFPDEYADTIVAFQVLEHLNEPVVFLRECYRVLVPGGKIIITVPFMWGIHEAPHDYFRYTKYGLEYLLKKVGFMNIEIDENANFWATWVLRFNYHTARYSKGFLKIPLIPIWFLAQMMAILLDKIDRNPSDAASYTALAEKPH